MNPDYKEYHPKWYRRRIPLVWWKENPAYIKFIVRELTSVCVAYAAIVLLVQVGLLARGVEAYNGFLSWLRSPTVIAIHVFVLLAVLFHTVTWLNLAPKALVVRLGGRRVPDSAILAGHYLAWLGASGLVLWILMGR